MLFVGSFLLLSASPTAPLAVSALLLAAAGALVVVGLVLASDDVEVAHR